MMTPDKKLALSERRAYDALGAEARKAYEDIGDFVHKQDPSVSKRCAELRSRLLLAGDRADVLWERVEAGMPLSTAARLLREAEQEWQRTAEDSRDMEEVLRERLRTYDSAGTVRRVGGKVFRTTSTTTSRAAKIAKGESKVSKKSNSSRHKTIVREAIAAWIASRIGKSENFGRMVDDAMREIEVVLDSLSSRIQRAVPSRSELFSACDMLNIPRPKWGKRADQERAWKNRTSALKATHPDTLGHDGAVRAFQGIKDAYDVIAAYNDSMDAIHNPREGNTDLVEGEQSEEGERDDVPQET
jgi:hypothetical protein